MFEYEHRNDELLSRSAFIVRVMWSVGIALGLTIVSLAMGAFGYHETLRLPWIDAVLNAAMILTGMGPVNQINTTAGKLFGTFYALYSGVAFLSTAAVLFAPLAHRFLHKFHLELEDKDKSGN
jgi:Na+/melibiose symporter-like transporter